MWYVGGKSRQRKAITAELVRRYAGQATYVEPFCGAMTVAEKVVPALAVAGVKRFVLSDVSVALMSMWRALKNGWHPPDFVSKETYYKTKEENDPSNPMTAHCGFACSAYGKWWGGYWHKKDGKYDMHLVAKKVAVRIGAILKAHDVILRCMSYQKMHPAGALMYLDPPYEGRQAKHDCGCMNYRAFWRWAGMLAETNDVIVTEFVKPKGWRTVYEWGNTISIESKKCCAVNERIFERVKEDEKGNNGERPTAAKIQEWR